MPATRLPRGAPGRADIVNFDGCYHGHADSPLVTPGPGGATSGVPDSLVVPPALGALTLAVPFTDLAAVSKIARARKIVHAVDNTFLTPYYQLPLELGADLVVHSTTKYMDGHNATVGGAVVSSTKELYEKIRFMIPSPGLPMQ